MVQRITPSRPGYEHRTLRCTKCGHIHQRQVVSSPSPSEPLDCFDSNEMRLGMRNRKKVVFLTADHLEEQADARASEAKQLPEGEARQNALRNAARSEG
jgi:DNA replicative helicase MCM subunit Mcm2 (Cdc46/Mcm family)